MRMKRKSSTDLGRAAGYGIGRAIGSYGGPVAGYAGGMVGSYIGGKLTEGPKKAFSNESTLSSRNAVARKKGAKLSKANNKKGRVKVSSALRKKISKVIEEKKIHGSWTQLSFGYIVRPSSNAQTVQTIQQTGFNDFAGGWAFLPEIFLHCASVLFNGKTDSQVARDINNTANLGMTNTGEGNTAGQGTYGCNAKFVVNKSWMAYHMKNNTQQTLKIRAYTVSIKSPQAFLSNTLVDPANNTVGSQVTNISPIDNWVASLATKTGQNVLDADIFRIGMRPESDPNFKKLFNYEITEIIMDPGQTHTCNISGPSNETLDFGKYYQSNHFMSIQKYSRFTFFIVESDLIQGGGETNTVIGRFKLGGSGTVCIERKFHFGMSIPESAGIRFGAGLSTNQSIETNYHKPVFGHAVYSANSPATLQRIDELQPATIES